MIHSFFVTRKSKSPSVAFVTCLCFFFSGLHLFTHIYCISCHQVRVFGGRVSHVFFLTITRPPRAFKLTSEFLRQSVLSNLQPLCCLCGCRPARLCLPALTIALVSFSMTWKTWCHYPVSLLHTAPSTSLTAGCLAGSLYAEFKGRKLCK